MKIYPSRIARDVKRAFVGLAGSVERSEFYLTCVDTGESVTLCQTPEKISVKTDASFRTYNIVERGEISFPKGQKLEHISWKGVLPGAQVVLYNNVSKQAWEQPEELIKVFRRWREKNRKLKLLVTQTPLNCETFLKSFDYEASGGQGDYKYTIELIAAKELTFETVAEADERRMKAVDDEQQALLERAAKKIPIGALVETVDDIFAAVQLLTGKGSLSDIERVLGAVGMGSALGSTKTLNPFDIILN